MRIKQNLDSIIYEKMIDSLILGEYRMGEKIVLDDLAEKFSVSRTPVVQAVRMLVANGVLEQLPGGHARVPEFTLAEVGQIRDVRFLLESYALEELQNRTTGDRYAQWCEEMKQIADDCSRYHVVHDILQFNKSDLRFHACLVKGSENTFLIDLYQKIQGCFVVANYLTYAWTTEDSQVAAAAHHAILEALMDRDLERCKEQLNKHIHTVYRAAES